MGDVYVMLVLGIAMYFLEKFGFTLTVHQLVPKELYVLLIITLLWSLRILGV